MTETFRSWVLMAVLIPAILAGSACKTMPKEGKIALTPVTVVRDTVDLPLMGLTNFFSWAAQRSGEPVPQANVGWTLRGGPNFGVGWNLGVVVWAVFSGVFGTIDYVICRSIVPNFPYGVTPWKQKDEKWGKMLYPNTKALWAMPESLEDIEEPASDKDSVPHQASP